MNEACAYSNARNAFVGARKDDLDVFSFCSFRCEPLLITCEPLLKAVYHSISRYVAVFCGGSDGGISPLHQPQVSSSYS